jgi:hypothetical protein
MSIIQDFNLSNLDSLLRTFSERPQALNLDTKLAQLMQALLADHLDLLPLPGQGHTLQRWQTLARVAGCDLALAKLYEGHTDALAILAECGSAHLVGDAIWGVWAAEPPDARARVVSREGDQVRLAGRKAWCSGALQIDRALITAWADDDQPQLVAIELAHTRQRLHIDNWQAVGMGTGDCGRPARPIPVSPRLLAWRCRHRRLLVWRRRGVGGLPAGAVPQTPARPPCPGAPGRRGCSAIRRPRRVARMRRVDRPPAHGRCQFRSSSGACPG